MHALTTQETYSKAQNVRTHIIFDKSHNAAIESVPPETMYLSRNVVSSRHRTLSLVICQPICICVHLVTSRRCAASTEVCSKAYFLSRSTSKHIHSPVCPSSSYCGAVPPGYGTTVPGQQCAMDDEHRTIAIERISLSYRAPFQMTSQQILTSHSHRR